MKRASLLLLTTIFACYAAIADPRTEFRAYIANKLKQQDKVWLPFSAKKPGCHNMIITLEVYRVAQIGFESCTIYSEKDCKPGSEIEVRWKNEKKPTTVITPGARWFLPGETGSDMASWKCVTKDDGDNKAAQ